MGACCDGIEDLRGTLRARELELDIIKREKKDLEEKVKVLSKNVAGVELQRTSPNSNVDNKSRNPDNSRLISETTAELKFKESRIVELEKQLMSYQQQGAVNSQNQSEEVRQLRRELSAITIEKNKLIAQLESFKAEAVNYRKKEAEILTKNAQIEQMSRRLTQVTPELKRREAELVEIRKKESELRLSKDKVEKELAGVQSKLGIAYGNLDLANRKVDIEKEVQKKLEASMVEITKKKDEAERALAEAEQARFSAETACLEAEQQITRLEKEIRKMKENYVEKEKYREKEKECDLIRREIDHHKARAVELEREIGNIKNQLTSNPTPISPASTSTLFYGRTLEGNEDYKEFMVSFLEKRTRMRIAKTDHLYSFDPLNKTNVHKYIDGKENLLVIVKTKEGYLFGGWSEEGLQPKKKSTRDGLIFSLTNRRVYNVISGRQAVTYDDFYIIFGNSEIRIRTNEDKVFSNFGISNGYYESKGDRVDILIGDKEREIPIEGYDIFQLILKEK